MIRHLIEHFLIGYRRAQPVEYEWRTREPLPHYEPDANGNVYIWTKDGMVPAYTVGEGTERIFVMVDTTGSYAAMDPADLHSHPLTSPVERGWSFRFTPMPTDPVAEFDIVDRLLEEDGR